MTDWIFYTLGSIFVLGSLLFILFTQSVKLFYILILGIILAGANILLWDIAFAPFSRIFGVFLINALQNDDNVQSIFKVVAVFFFHNELWLRIAFLLITLSVTLVILTVLDGLVLSRFFSPHVFYGRFRNLFFKFIVGGIFLSSLLVFIGAPFFITHGNQFPKALSTNTITNWAQTKSKFFDLKNTNLNLKKVINFEQNYNQLTDEDDKKGLILNTYDFLQRVLPTDLFTTISNKQADFTNTQNSPSSTNGSETTISTAINQLKQSSSSSESASTIKNILPKVKKIFVQKINEFKKYPWISLLLPHNQN